MNSGNGRKRIPLQADVAMINLTSSDDDDLYPPIDQNIVENVDLYDSVDWLPPHQNNMIWQETVVMESQIQDANDKIKKLNDVIFKYVCLNIRLPLLISHFSDQICI